MGLEPNKQGGIKGAVSTQKRIFVLLTSNWGTLKTNERKQQQEQSSTPASVVDVIWLEPKTRTSLPRGLWAVKPGLGFCLGKTLILRRGLQCDAFRYTSEYTTTFYIVAVQVHLGLYIFPSHNSTRIWVRIDT